MSILDKNGNPIEYYANFPNDQEILNIEFGAGKNNFGKREYPSCYLTDKYFPQVPSYFNEYDSEEIDYHFLDHTCDFYESHFERNFDNIILCNPYDYGFKKLGDAKKFFNRAGTLLNANGRLHIIGSSFNPWCNKESLDKFIKNEIEQYFSTYKFELESYEDLDTDHVINQKYDFYSTGLNQKTTPNERLILKKS